MKYGTEEDKIAYLTRHGTTEATQDVREGRRQRLKSSILTSPRYRSNVAHRGKDLH